MLPFNGEAFGSVKERDNYGFGHHRTMICWTHSELPNLKVGRRRATCDSESLRDTPILPRIPTVSIVTVVGILRSVRPDFRQTVENKGPRSSECGLPAFWRTQRPIIFMLVDNQVLPWKSAQIRDMPCGAKHGEGPHLFRLDRASITLIPETWGGDPSGRSVSG